MVFTVKRFVKHSSIYAIGNLANRFGAFLLLPLYTTFLTTAQYGILELFYSTSSVVNSFLGFGLGHATLRFYFEYDDIQEKRKVVSTSLIASFIITSAGVFLLSFGSRKLSMLLFDSYDYVMAFYVLYAIIVLEISTRICFAFMRAMEYSKFFVYVNLIKLAIQVSFNYYAVAILKMGVTGILVGNLIAVATSWVFVGYITIKENGLKFDVNKFKELFSYSYPFYGSSIMSIVFKNADKFLLKSFVSLEAVGVYSLALKFAQIPIELFHEPFKSNYGAFRFAIMKEPEAEVLQVRITRYMVVGMVALSLVIGLFSIDVLRIMSSTEFYASANYIPILLFAICILSLNYPFQTGILISKKTGYAFYITTIGGILTIAFNMVLIPYLDAYGAALSYLLAVLCGNFMTLRVSQRLLPVNYDFEKIRLIILNGTLIYSMTLAVSQFGIINNIILMFAFKMLLLIFFPILLIISSCIEKDEVNYIIASAGKLRDQFRRIQS